MTRTRSLAALVALSLVACAPLGVEDRDGEEPTLATEPVFDGAADTAARPTRLGRIASGETKQGTFSSTARYLSWTFDAREGERIHLTAYGVSPRDLDTVVVLYRATRTGMPTGSAIALNDDAAPGTRSSYLEHEATVTGPYAAIVRRRDYGRTGTVALSLEIEPASGCHGRPDGTACDDGNACTNDDVCAAGACAGAPIACEASDACHAAMCDRATGTCMQAPVADGVACDDADACTTADQCTAGVCGGTAIACTPTDVVVHVTGSTGAAIFDASVRAYSGDLEVARTRTIWDGTATLTLAPGHYRFEAVYQGLPAWSSDTDACATPSCDHAEIAFPAVSPYRVVTWDPYEEPAYRGGELYPYDAFFERDGLYVEYWAIDHYDTASATFTSAHPHIGNEGWMVDGSYGNRSNGENQHAFGEIQQGFFVRLPDGGAFDLVSLDWRVRADADASHVSSIPGNDPSDVQVLIATTLDLAVPATHAFSRYHVGSAETTRFETLRPTEFTNVTSVFISSTGNVTFDDVVVRPR